MFCGFTAQPPPSKVSREIFQSKNSFQGENKMSINKGTDKVKPFGTCPEHGVLCGCPKNSDNRGTAKKYFRKKR